MYTRNNLRDINYERARVIDNAITELMKNVVRGTPYTARDLSVMTEGVIPTSIFEDCLSRGFRTCRRQRRETYNLFGDFRAKCDIRKEGVRRITIKEYNENGELISEYQKRRGRPYYTATF